MMDETHLIEILAEASHDLWMEDKLKQGWAYSHHTDLNRKLHSRLKPYSALDDAEKIMERNLVNFIPIILEKAGFKIVPKGEID